MNKAPSLWDRICGDGKVVVIAEAGVNHDGSVELAHELIDLAAECGVDAIKFQTFDPSKLTSVSAPKAQYQVQSNSPTTQFELISRLALPRAIWSEISDHCVARNLKFLSTPFDAESARMLVDLGIEMIKVPSGEVTNHQYLQIIAQLGCPLLLSTGMANMNEVADALSVVTDAPGIAIMHCVSAYPTPLSDANIKALLTLEKTFGYPTGWSDHTIGVESAIAAIALGARVVEKHFTLDSRRAGPDHAMSADPQTMANYVEAIRKTELLLGTGNKVAQPSELNVRQVARRSWHATRDLMMGHVLSEQDLLALRPGTGVPPSVDVVGRRLRSSVRCGQILNWTDLDG